MEKLEPIIRHHFWIVFLVALIMPPVAWWMTTGELAAEISERTSSLDSTFSGIATGQGAANDDWTSGVNDLIAIREEQNRLALDRLWKAQTDLMLWPGNVERWMTTCPYRGEIEDARIKQILPDLYRDDYEREVRRVWLIPEPIDDGVNRVEPGLDQKLVFPYEQIPRTPAQKWTVLPPTWSEIWNAQEDLWLLSEILSAVKRTNKSTSSITDSYVKQILQVQLFGGSRAAAGSASAGSAPGEGYPGGMPGMPGMPIGGIARGANVLSKPSEFPISEEYTVTGLPAAGMNNMYSSSGESGAASAEAGSDPESDENRYVQKEEAYRTRGFKLKVAIHQMHVPDLIRELLNSQYPIEVIRFQQSAMNPEEPGKPAATGYPGNSLAGSPYAGGGAELESPTDYSEESSSDDFGFDGGTGTDGLAAKSYSAPNIANVQASLADRDLVDLVVVGEIYIYNPPVVEETAEDAAEAAPAADTSAAAESAPADGAAETNAGEGIESPAVAPVTPVSPADGDSGVAAPAGENVPPGAIAPAATVPAGSETPDETSPATDGGAPTVPPDNTAEEAGTSESDDSSSTEDEAAPAADAS